MKKNKVFSTIVILCLLTGCADVPKQEAGEGTAKAEKTQQDNVVLNMGGEVDASEYDYLTETDKGYICKVSFGEGEEKLNIDAVVTNTGGEEVSLLQAKPLSKALNVNQIKEIFFSDINGIEDKTDDMISELCLTPIEERQPLWVPENPLYLSAMDNDFCFYRETDMSLYYSNAILGRCALDFINSDSKKTESSTQDVSENYTMTTAWNEFAELWSQLDIGDVDMEYCSSVSDDNGTGYYTFDFTILINGLPIIANRGSGAISDLVPCGNVEIGENGICEMQVSDLLWEKISEEPETCMNIVQAMERLEKGVTDGSIRCTSSLVFNKVELGYWISTEDGETAKLKPMWRIYIPISERENMNYDDSIPTDIMIDAVSGDVRLNR
jgi:hypothetical protein